MNLEHKIALFLSFHPIPYPSPETIWAIPCDTMRSEKLAETEEDRLEHRTDGTDAFDTLFIGCEKFPQSDYSAGMVDTSGVM